MSVAFVRLEPPLGPSFEVAVSDQATDPMSRAIVDGTWQFDTSYALIESMLGGGNRLLVDVGAHIGTVAFGAAAMGSRVVAIEASPTNARLLRTGLARNGFVAVEVIEVAASDRSGALDFRENGPFSHVPTALEVPTGTVLADTVDDLLARLGAERVDLVKIDVEGWELAVIRGMTRTLSREDAPPIVFEGNGHILRLRDQRAADLRLALAEHGYRGYLIEPGRLVPVDPGDFQPSTLVDYLAVKDREPSIAGWPVGSNLAPAEIAARVLADSHSPINEYRAYAAWMLEHAPDWLRARPDVQNALAGLRTDPELFVSLSAGWSVPG